MPFLDSIKLIMQPPTSPSDPPSGEGWQFVERSLAIELPKDYKDFVSVYGTGVINHFVWILSPFTSNKNLNLIYQAMTRLDAQRQFHAESATVSQYSLYPAPNGIFPWGVTDNGDVLYWHCRGPSSIWTIAICDSRSSKWQAFDLTMGQFLIAVLTKRLIVDTFPDDFLSETPHFSQESGIGPILTV